MACEICKKPYIPSSEENTFHSNEKPHVCNVCGKSFSLKIQLKRHLLSHEGNLPYICNSCEKHADENNSYNLRLSQKGNYRCETCHKYFTSKRLLLRHASEHTLENVLYCEDCGESFKNVTALKKHAVTHKPKKGYSKNNTQKQSSEMSHTCHECGKNFTQLQQYEKHCLCHHKCKCSVCNAVFASNKLLEKHQENGDCKSKILTNSSLDSSNLSSDNLNSSNFDDKKHSCGICNKSFTRKSALEGHMASHLTENRESAVEDDSDNDADFQCNYKGDKFNDQSKQLFLPKLKIRRTFQCEKCEMVCASKKSLNAHMLAHQNITEDCVAEGKKKYVCRICNETFISKDDYKKHKLLHETKRVEEKSVEKEQKSYICEICSKVFSKRRHLRKHIKNHFAGVDPHENNTISLEDFHEGKRRKRSKNFACSFCGKLFAGETCLKKHEAKHADDDKEDSLSKGKKGKKPKTLICEICSEDFTGRRHAYIKHKLSHTPEVCGICDARFPDRASLREHCRIHIGTEEGRRFVECSQKALDAKNGIVPPEPKVEYIYLVLR